jgi:uncharacterized protein
MRLVIDTNIVISGLLWNGPPRRLIEMAIAERIALYSSPTLIDELAHTLSYRKFAKRLALFEVSIATWVARYQALVTVVTPLQVPAVIANDPDDDHVLACAVTARAHLIASGDGDLHELGSQYQGIRIVTPAQAVRIIEAIPPH